MKTLLLLLATAAVALAAPKPNIVLIMTDDMGWSDLGCYGGEIPTPHLDALAAGGVRFTQFYNTARCCPTRASLLTGLYPHQAGVGHMTEDRGCDGYRGQLNDRCVTIAEALRPAGYKNYAVGKWHVSRNIKDDGDRSRWPLQRGFDRFYGTVTGGGNFFDPGNLTRGNTNISPFADAEYRPAQYYYTDAITDHAVRFLGEHRREHADAPFFMYVAYTAAHWPLHAPEEEIARFRGKYDAGYAAIRDARLAKLRTLGLLDTTPAPFAHEWEKVEHQAWEARCMEVYAAQVARMDTGVGRIVEALTKSGALENTLVLYLQDNGACAELIHRTTQDRRGEKPTLPVQAAEFIRHEVIPKQTRDGWPVLGGPHVMPGPADTYQSYGKAWAAVSNTPLREFKHWVHEGGIRTPLIAHWPAGIAARGALSARPGHLVDIMATCLDVAGAAAPTERAGTTVQPPEGVSLGHVFRDGAAQRGKPIFWEHEGNRALRIGDWKLVAKGPAGAWELYDLATDRTEQRDLAAREPARVKEMVAQWESEARRMNVLPWIWKPAYGSGGEQNIDVHGAPEFADDAHGASARTFALKAGDDLSGDAAPRVAGKGFAVTVEIVEPARDGVIVAQGGSQHGWALYLREGRAHFALRRAGKLATVPGPLVEKPGALALTLGVDGATAFAFPDTAPAPGKVPGPLTKHPTDGLQVGRDLGGHVGDWPDDFPFAGKLGAVHVKVR